MLNLHVDNVGDVVVIECVGRIVQSADAFKLRQVVTLESDARTIVLELSEVTSVEGGGLGMLMFLKQWAQDHDIRLKLFNPTPAVRERLKRASFMPSLELATIDEIRALLAISDKEYAAAA